MTSFLELWTEFTVFFEHLECQLNVSIDTAIVDVYPCLDDRQETTEYDYRQEQDCDCECFRHLYFP